MVSNAGLNPGPVTELARTDLSRIAQGGSTLPENEIISMVHSAYTGQVTTPAPSGHPGLFGMVGNFFGDITTDVRSFMPGLVHEGADIINPRKWAQVPGAISNIKMDSIPDFARSIAAVPIFGNLIPGTFALSAGLSGFERHPLNFALDLLPYAAEGSKLATAGLDVADRPALAALQEGHPLKALADASGLTKKFDQMLTSSGTLSQFAYMPVWRKFSELTRIYARKFGEGTVQELRNIGILSKSISNEEAARLGWEAAHYDPRYEQPAVHVDPSQVLAAKGDHQLAFGNVPTGRDVIAYTVGPEATPVDKAAIYFDPQQAAQYVPEGLDPSQFIQQVRVDPKDITMTDTTVTGKNLIPNMRDGQPIYYSPSHVKMLKGVRDYVNTHRALSVEKLKTKKGESPNVYLPDPVTGEARVYPRDSAMFKAHATMQAKNETRVAAETKVRHLQQQVEDKAREAQGQTERYVNFGESEAAAAQRPPTVPSVEQLHQASQGLILQGMAGENRDVFDRLDRAFSSGQPVRVKNAAIQAMNVLRRDPMHDPAELAYLQYIKEKANGLTSRIELAQNKARKAVRAYNELQTAQQGLQAASMAAEVATKDYYDTALSTPPDVAHPLLQDQAKGVAQRMLQQKLFKDVTELRTQVQGAGLTEAIQQAFNEYKKLAVKVTDATSKEELSTLVGEDTFQSVMKQTFADWTQMIKAGYDPIWIHQVDPTHYEHMTFGRIRPLPDRLYEPGQHKERIFDFTPQVLDIRAALTDMAAEYLRQEATKQYLDWMVNSSGAVHKAEDLRADLEKRYPNEPALVASHLKQDWVPFEPSQYIKDYKHAELFIPRTISDGFHKLMQGDRLPFKAERDPIHRVWKVSVLTGPRHFVHIAVGGLVMVGLQDPGAFTELAHPLALLKMAREGVVPREFAHLIDPEVAAQLRKGQYEEMISQIMESTDSFVATPDHVMQLRAGKKLGEWWRASNLRKGLVNTEEAINKFENNLTDMYRAATFIDQMKHGATNEAALAHVNKVLIDVDNMTPFEQTVLKQIFPFWTFTKHILRYVLSYPADHPLRASILSKLALNIEAGNTSGDPGKLSKLLMIGGTDALGNVTSVDISNANPFRSMASIFSMAGFFQGLAPEYQLALKKMGFNTLTGTPSLAANFTYDQYAGTNVPQKTPMNLFDFVGTFIPEADIIDHYFLFTDTMRTLKTRDPYAYNKLLYQELNLPFIISPININDVRAKAAAMQFRDAQDAVANAFKTGNTDTLRRFDAVPWNGRLYPADQVANYIDNYDQMFPGIAPKAVVRKPRVPRVKAL